ncbi:Peroxisomal membrane protein 2 [Oopsacas minuta]|uniref:Peroxisomal membrane protein 2 n=1 Tax=Oopsacas minuta TaxID=111878 RepID=A0AAV7K075_9METZ|nr:Peroxisomal membrane protein 2 [Oopsacas minuta]
MGNSISTPIITEPEKKPGRSLLIECISSGIIGAIAEILSQLIKSSSLNNFNIHNIISYFIFGVITAPISKKLFILLEYLLKDIPEGFSKFFKKVIIERAIFAPLFLFLYKMLIPLLQGQPLSDVIKKLPQNFLITLLINILVWSPFSYINMNYVPIEKRVISANLMGLLWTCFLSFQSSP